MTPLSVQDRFAQPPDFLGEDFVFVVCQQAAEATIKRYLTTEQSSFRLAFSRPGLITFKIVRQSPSSIIELPKHPLIRQSGWVLEQVHGSVAEEMVHQVCSNFGDSWDGLHVFARDPVPPGVRGFEPGFSALSQEIGQLFQRAFDREIPINQPCPAGSMIMDIVLVEPNHWIVAYHRSIQDDVSSGWPGGAYYLELPATAISRAYLKMAEAIAWSQLPLESGDMIVEIGSAPGGASQRLLDMGLVVTGVDPAEMDPILLEHPRFTHWRAKSMAVKRRKYSQFRWLTADANVAPNYTLDSVEDIVNYPTSKFEGLILTFKLSSYQLLENLEAYLNRIRSWNFGQVRARQLAHNRKEICVVAQR